MKKEIVLEAINLEKKFDFPEKRVLFSKVSLRLHKAETLAIMGPSGVGKSTLLHHLGTLEGQIEGQLIINGAIVNEKNVAKIRNEEIGFIFQSFHLLEDYSVIENVLMPLKIKRVKTDKNSTAFKQCMDLLAYVGLTHEAFKECKNLSGGEKQRVAIARALSNSPSLILADEPTGNLDEVSGNKVQELLLFSAKNFEKGLIIVTHDQKLADLCDRKFILKNGVLECME